MFHPCDRVRYSKLVACPYLENFGKSSHFFNPQTPALLSLIRLLPLRYPDCDTTLKNKVALQKCSTSKIGFDAIITTSAHDRELGFPRGLINRWRVNRQRNKRGKNITLRLLQNQSHTTIERSNDRNFFCSFGKQFTIRKRVWTLA